MTRSRVTRITESDSECNTILQHQKLLAAMRRSRAGTDEEIRGMQNIVAFRLRQSRRGPGFSATSAALLAISAVKAPVTGETQLASLLRGEIANIVAGAFFLFICVIA